MGCFVGRKGVCVQGPPITALAWGVKQIDWQASGGQFQTLWSLFIQFSSETSAVKQLKGQRRPQRRCEGLAYSLNIHFHILFQPTTKPQIPKFTPSSQEMFAF